MCLGAGPGYKQLLPLQHQEPQREMGSTRSPARAVSRGWGQVGSPGHKAGGLLGDRVPHPAAEGSVPLAGAGTQRSSQAGGRSTGAH